MKWLYIAIGALIMMIAVSCIGKYQDTHIVKSIHVGTQP